MDEVESLREALASAQQLVAAQAGRLRQQELVLSGIQAISVGDEPGEAIAQAFEVLRTALDFDLALVLEPHGQDRYVCIASTDEGCVGAEWAGGDFFRSVAAGRAAVVPDSSRTPEWSESPPCPPKPAGALFVPISTAAGAGVLILRADHHGAYSAGDAALVSKLGLLVSQTLAAGQQRRLTEAVHRSEVEREAAVRANEVKSQFIANMSHEIRTPLNGVIAVADLLRQTDLSSRQQEMAGVILDSGRMLERLLNDVLDFAKIESGRLDLEVRPFNLKADLQSVFDLFAAKADARGLYLRVRHGREAAGWFEGDSLRIRQIVGNLLSNAVKFTHAGGVDVQVDVERAGAASIVRIGVSDSGCGFSQLTAERLFERFEQEDGSITRKFGGSGLGLPIARTLARLMGGDIRCQSAPGKGALFEAWFQARPVEPAGEACAEGATTATLEDALKVLVVEDNPNNQRIVGMILDSTGAVATFAENGQEACLAVETQDFDVILMDLQMPVMDGLRATRTIRAWERRLGRSPTPIIALSANAMTHQVEEARAAGVDAHVAKPINPSSLLSTMAELCAARPGGLPVEVDYSSGSSPMADCR